MDFYLITLKSMYKLLSDCGEELNAAYISDCIDRWTSSRDVDYLLKGFSERGVFAAFRFANTKFDTEEKKFWTQQLFGGLVAMAMQLARFNKEGKSISIGFIRQNFGHQAEVIHASVCQACSAKQINAVDIDRYIAMPVISEAIVEGLDHGDLEERTAAIMQLSYPRIKNEREDAKLRAANMDISVSSSRAPVNRCFRCGSQNIKTVRMLKSLRKKEFVILNK